MASAELYLASGSPRRRDLLGQIGVRFEILSVVINEEPLANESATDYVTRLAIEKARSGWTYSQDHLSLPVLGADTIVVFDQHILGKPNDEEDAVRMLQMLSDKTHTVMTAVAVVKGRTEHVKLVTSDVTFQPLSICQCREYWQTGEPVDKAGSYGIQGYGGLMATHLSGSYSGVVGLPLNETAQLLTLFNVSVWNQK